jgi:hypothetical protein
VRYASVVCERAQEHGPRVYPFANRTVFWRFADPMAACGSAAEQLAAFRRVREAIDESVRRFLREGGGTMTQRRSGVRGELVGEPARTGRR